MFLVIPLFLGVFTPESLLPDGMDSSLSVNPYTGEALEVRKGTVAATLNNVAELNGLLHSGARQLIQDSEAVLTPLLASLRGVGMFHLFEPEAWIGKGEQPGRVLIAVLYLEKYPDALTPSVRKQLKSVRKKAPPYLKERINSIL